MDSRSAYRLQLMEKLGAPLLAALPDGMDGERAAETVAALVGRSVQAGLQLSQSMKLTDQDGDIDSIRLSLAAIAAPLISHSFKETGRLPDDGAIEKIVKGMEATLVFAENFTPAIEHTARLKSLHNPLPLIDLTQITLLSLNALSPVVQALQQFSFGQGDASLIKDISGRIQTIAQQISAASVKGDESDQAFGKLLILRALSELFAAAHASVLRGHKGDAAPTLDAVWQVFEQQAAMMLALSGAAVPTGQTSKAPASTPVAQSGPMGFFKQGDAAPAENAAASASIPPPPPPAAPPVSSGSPMSFFKPGQKKADGSDE